MVVKPMLACSLDNMKDMTFPKLVSYKLDGCLALIVDGVVQTRSGKPFPSETVQKLFGKQELNGLVGEIIVGAPNIPTTFNTTTGAVRSKSLPADISEGMFHFYVFDLWSSTEAYNTRLEIATNIVMNSQGEDQISILVQVECCDYEGLLSLEEEALEAGYEGLIARDPRGLYKNGRCTPKSQTLVKVKRFLQDEAKIIGFEELMHNANEAKTNELGHTERSGHKENLVGMDTLGALVCETNGGVKFKIGTGFSAKQRQDLWKIRESILGDFVTYKKFPIGEMNGVPRLPVILNIDEFIGIRMKEDM
jgi:DNA ligase 1